ncbi:MAG: hypothetical protein WBL93_06535 [Lutisporaceae bacterium]
MRHLLSKRIICSALAFTLIIASGTFVFAELDNGVNRNMSSATLVMRISNPPANSHKHEGFKTVINKLVEEKKLSREKADQIIKHVEEKVKEQTNKVEKQDKRKFQKSHLIEELKKDGIINDTEAEAIRSKFKEIREQILTDKLNGMVQKGTITQIQSDKVKMYFENARKERTEKLKNMTEEQRKTYFKEHKRGQDVIEKLVEDGVITKEQAEELRKTLMEGHKNHNG